MHGGLKSTNTIVTALLSGAADRQVNDWAGMRAGATMSGSNSWMTSAQRSRRHRRAQRTTGQRQSWTKHQTWGRVCGCQSEGSARANMARSRRTVTGEAGPASHAGKLFELL